MRSFRPRFGFGEGHGGPGPWGAGRFFGSGELRIAVLSLLSESPGHGYELMNRLQERCGGAYQASAGAIYPTLQQLEDEGLIRCEPRDGKKIYALTADGKRELASGTVVAERIWERAENWSEWGAARHPSAAEVMGPALRIIKTAFHAVMHSHGDPEVIDTVRTILEKARAEIERSVRRRK